MKDISAKQSYELTPGLATLPLIGIRHDRGLILQTAQIRAARALLGWKQRDLAKVSRVNVTTVRRIESKAGRATGYVSTLVRIQSAFQRAGIQFLDNDTSGGIGVRFAAPNT